MWPLAAVLAHDGEKNLLESRFASFFAGDARTQLVERALSDEPAFVNDGHMAAEALDYFQNVRSKKDSDAAFGLMLDESQ